MLGREGRRRTHLTETFESEGAEHSSSRFLMDRTLYKGIKYPCLQTDKTTSAKSSMLATTAVTSEKKSS